MISVKYYNNRQRQRLPSTESSASDEVLDCGPSSNEYVFLGKYHAANVSNSRQFHSVAISRS